LPINERDLRLGYVFIIDHPRLTHFEPEVISLASPLADTCKDRKPTVRLCDVIDEFLDQHRLADARAAKQPDLASAKEGLDQIDHLDSADKHLLVDSLILERRRVAMDRIPQLSLDRSKFVDGLADDIEDSTKRAVPDRHFDLTSCVDGFHTAHHAIGGHHRDGSHTAFTEMLLDFADDVDWILHIEALASHTDR